MFGRWLAALALLAVIAGGAWFGLPESSKKLAVGDSVIDFSLPDLQGKMQNLPKGQPMLVNFWATWCPPCRQETPAMIQMYETYQAQGLKVVAVSVDRDLKQLHAFADEYHLPFDVRNDADSAVSTQYGVFRYPETFLVDKDGVIQAHLIGAIDWMSPSIQQKIQDLLAGQPLT